MSGGPVADYHSTAIVAEQLELQVLKNDTGAGVGGTTPTFNVVTTPSLDLTFASTDRWGLAFRYAPSFTARQLETSPALDVFNQGSLSLDWHDRRTRTTLAEQGSIGEITYATLPGTVSNAAAATPIQALPVNQILNIASSRTTLSVARIFAPRFSANVTGGYALSGGTDDLSRVTLPSQDGPLGNAHAEYLIGRRDRFVVDGDYSHVQFSATVCTDAPIQVAITATAPRCTPRVDQGSATAGVFHKIDRTSDLVLQAGAAAIARRESADDSTFSVLPVATATFVERTGLRQRSSLDVTLLARLTPVVAQQTGAIDTRLEGDAGIDLVHKRVVFHALARASDSLGGEAGGYFDAYGEASLGYRLNRTFVVSAGERVDWETIEEGPSILSSFSFVRIVATSRTVRF